MVLDNLEDDFSAGTLRTVYRETSVSELKITSIERNNYERGSGYASVRLFIVNRATGASRGYAEIFEDCALEWR